MQTKAHWIALGLGLASATGCNKIDELWARSHPGASADAASTTSAGTAGEEPQAQRRLGHERQHTVATANGSAPPSARSGDGGALAQTQAPDGGAIAPPSVPVVQPESTGPLMTALWVWVPVYERTDSRAARLGYLRAGAQVHVEPTPAGTEGCPRGWYAVQGGTGGYICNNRMASIELDEARRPLPSQPDMDAPMPYPYYVTYRPATMYRWLPSVADMREVEPERFGVTPASGAVALDGGASTTIPTGVTPAVLSTTAPVTGVGSAPGPQSPGNPDGGAARVAAAAQVGTRAQAEDAGVRIEDLAGQSGSPLLRRMLSGMYISVDREASSAGRRFWRTQNGGFVERGVVSRVSSPPTFQGIVLDAEHPLPVAFVTSLQAAAYTLSPGNVTATAGERVPRFTAVTLTEDPPVRVGRQEYHRARDGRYFNARHVRLIRTMAPPADVASNEKWIEVNLDRQMLIAYEGSRPVYVTLVSTGRRNRGSEERNYETIQGAFRIQSKHVATTMDGNSAGDGPYSIEDVPWVMYFENSFAMHGAFWHNSFGGMRSHGCVNMSPPDARWIFRWSEPALPSGWHGVYANASHPGTRVYVHYEAQELGERGGPTVVPPH